MKLSDIAARLGHPVEGDGRVEIHHISSLEEAGPGDLTFLASAKHAKKAEATKASAIIVGPGAGALPIPVIRAPDAYLAFAHALEVLYPRPKPTPGVHPLASIAKSARIGPGASIAPFAVIEDDVEIGKDAEIGPHVVIRRGARIGDSVLLHSRVVIREGCRLGHRVIIQDGTVIGADGFGFTKRPDGSHQKIPQVGIVVLEDDVEVQANTCIDRATLGATKIGRGTKIDNLVQVGHNCATGENSIVCSQVGMSGSTILGKSVTLGGQCGMAGHQKIGDGVTASARSGVPNDVEPGKHIAGFVAIDSREWLRYQIALPRLPDVMKDVRELRKRLETLEESKPS